MSSETKQSSERTSGSISAALSNPSPLPFQINFEYVDEGDGYIGFVSTNAVRMTNSSPNRRAKIYGDESAKPQTSLIGTNYFGSMPINFYSTVTMRNVRVIQNGDNVDIEFMANISRASRFWVPLMSFCITMMQDTIQMMMVKKTVWAI